MNTEMQISHWLILTILTDINLVIAFLIIIGCLYNIDLHIELWLFMPFCISLTVFLHCSFINSITMLLLHWNISKILGKICRFKKMSIVNRVAMYDTEDAFKPSNFLLVNMAKFTWPTRRWCKGHLRKSFVLIQNSWKCEFCWID